LFIDVVKCSALDASQSRIPRSLSQACCIHAEIYQLTETKNQHVESSIRYLTIMLTFLNHPVNICDWWRRLIVGLVKPNTHRRRDETVLSRRVGVGGVYMNSRRIRRCERTTQPSAVTQFTILQPMA